MGLTLTRRNSFALFIALALGLFATEAWIASVINWRQDPGAIALAITADIAIGVPLLYYVLLAHKGYLPTSWVIGLYFIALAAVRFILPVPYQSYLNFVDVLAPVGEVVALGVLAVKARDIVRQVRVLQADELYFTDALRKGIQHAFGRTFIASLLSTELSLMFFAFVGWFTRFHIDKPNHLAFSYHRNMSYRLVFLTVGFIAILETPVLHLIIQIWSPQAAWIVTFLSIYTLWWILGYYQSTRLQPVVLGPTDLHIRTGFRYRATIPLSHIAEVRKAMFADKQSEDFLNVAVFGEPSLVICLKEPEAVVGFFGKSEQCKLIGITLDDENAFRAEFTARMK